ncbi:AraC family transcriptional regulator [Streptomyces sp. AJS327]|uniref:helix-turn-helix transcriptional regulator n=1 Tax=Streptomyces sp. AJS327 TaxID=2545265 RepID=UPI0015DEB941|nr:helix-turn-helix transcriptional regulator [Streptomyces sp. AJS327]MBA0049930.1 AraC family transcriptional regulator [Streptomyces sp. AJS327]
MYEERPAREPGVPPGAVLWTRTAPEGDVGRVLPDGCMDLLLLRGELVVAGPDTRAHLVAGAPGERIIGLRFAPGTGPSVLGVPADELRDLRLPLARVWPEPAARRLAERVAEAERPSRALARGAAWAAGRTTADPLPGAVLRLLRAGAPVAGVAHEVGLSERQLRRRCHAAFGYGAKTLARVLRMRRALALAGEGLPPVRIAALAGYADQAHLSREIRALAGTSLRALLAERGGPGTRRGPETWGERGVWDGWDALGEPNR